MIKNVVYLYQGILFHKILFLFNYADWKKIPEDNILCDSINVTLLKWQNYIK